MIKTLNPAARVLHLSRSASRKLHSIEECCNIVIQWGRVVFLCVCYYLNSCILTSNVVDVLIFICYRNSQVLFYKQRAVVRQEWHSAWIYDTIPRVRLEADMT